MANWPIPTIATYAPCTRHQSDHKHWISFDTEMCKFFAENAKFIEKKINRNSGYVMSDQVSWTHNVSTINIHGRKRKGESTVPGHFLVFTMWS